MATLDMIQQSHKGDQNATLALIEKFNPLLRKYTNKLNYDDAYYDLLTDFLTFLSRFQTDTLISKNEGSVISYITTSIHNIYVKRLAQIIKGNEAMVFSDLSEQEQYYLHSLPSLNNDESKVVFSFLEDVLSEKEALVIRLIYSFGYSSADVAKKLGISRQAANQAKRRALLKLKTVLQENED